MIDFIRGTATAMITPFTNDGINYDSLKLMFDYQIANGTDALVVLGTTGEPCTMTDEERIEVIKFTIKHCKGKVKVIIGSGANNTKKAIALSKEAEELGADGLLCITPYYNKCTQKGIVEYYKAICDAVKIPVIAYNVPARTGVNIKSETAEKLAEIPNMAGIKEACGNMQQICETMRRVRGKMDLYSGDDNLNLPMLAIGAKGLISVVSNIIPKGVKLMYSFVQKGDLATANAMQDSMLPLIDACFTEVNPIPVKAGLNMIGFDVGTPRGPLTELEEHNKKIMADALKTVGFNI